MKKLTSLLLCLLWLSLASNAKAETSMLEDPRLLEAAVAMELTAEQRQVFQQHLSDYLTKLATATKKLMQPNNVTNLPKQITRKRNQLTRSLDKQMASLLTEEQYLLYEEYRTLLLAKMSGALGDQGKEGTTSFSTMMGSGTQGT